MPCALLRYCRRAGGSSKQAVPWLSKRLGKRSIPENREKILMDQNQQNRWKRDFLTIAGGQTVSLIGSAAVQFSLIWWLASETAPPFL